MSSDMNPPGHVAVPGWQPIETALKDRPLLLGQFEAGGIWSVYSGQYFTKSEIRNDWPDGEDCEPGWYETSVECSDDTNCWPASPSHWMPIPAPPNQGGNIVTDAEIANVDSTEAKAAE